MVSAWLPREELSHILAALTAPNRLVCEVQMETGLRVGDVLRLRTDDVMRDRFTIKEEKTGKPRRVRLSVQLRMRLLRQAGRVYIFESRTNQYRHRTRQAVFKDLKRACRAFRVSECVGTHSMRKSFATEYFRRTGDLRKVQTLLNHGSEAVTMVYAMADVLTRRRNGEKI